MVKTQVKGNWRIYVQFLKIILWVEYLLSLLLFIFIFFISNVEYCRNERKQVLWGSEGLDKIWQTTFSISNIISYILVHITNI